MPDEQHEPVNEYEREPMPEKTRLGSKSFIGQYAGKHTADTELKLGPLFVAAGVSASDLIMGLRAGNLLAVLSWRFLTAPSATRARLTGTILPAIFFRNGSVGLVEAKTWMLVATAGWLVTVPIWRGRQTA